MIGEESMTDALVSGPASTGKVCTLRQPLAAPRAQSGGSICETNDPPGTASSVCAASSARPSATSRSAWRSRPWPEFSTRTRSRASPSGGPQACAESRTVAETASLRRTTRPTSPVPGCISGSTSRPDGMLTPVTDSAVRRSAIETAMSASRGTASSKPNSSRPATTTRSAAR
jgi:hypothetical protein